MEINSFSILFIAIASIVGLWIIFYFIPIGLWFTAILAGVRISILQLVFMRFRRVPPTIIVRAMIAAAKGGVDADLDSLEAHYLAGGDVQKVVNGLIYAKSTGTELTFQQAARLDLAGKDIILECENKIRGSADNEASEKPVLHQRNKELIHRWVDLFNKADAEQLSVLYHDTAINYQVPNEPIEGKAAIREMFRKEFASAEMTCIIEQVLTDGDWAVLEWKDPLELRGCGFFLINDGKIKYQRGYWDKLSFLRLHNLPFPTN